MRCKLICRWLAGPAGPAAVALRDARLASVDRPPRERSEVLVRKAEDVAFVKDTVASVAEWLQVRGRALACWRWVGVGGWVISPAAAC